MYWEVKRGNLLATNQVGWFLAGGFRLQGSKLPPAAGAKPGSLSFLFKAQNTAQLRTQPPSASRSCPPMQKAEPLLDWTRLCVTFDRGMQVAACASQCRSRHPISRIRLCAARAHCGQRNREVLCVPAAKWTDHVGVRNRVSRAAQVFEPCRRCGDKPPSGRCSWSRLGPSRDQTRSGRLFVSSSSSQQLLVPCLALLALTPSLCVRMLPRLPQPRSGDQPRVRCGPGAERPLTRP